jgi:hypothetical protein
MGWSGGRLAEVRALPIEEQTLTLMLLGLPAIAVAAANVGHGGLAPRYMLPTVLGGALALGYVVDGIPSAGREVLLILLLMNYAFSYHVVMKGVKGSLNEPRAIASLEVKAIGAHHHESDLPIVISSGIRYLPMAYYTPADSNGKLYAIVDPPAAVRLTDEKSDSVDLALLVLRRYFPLQVEDYVGFVSKHQEFLLVTGGGFEWLAARLAHDGYTLRLVSAEVGSTVYKVTVRP